MNNFSFSQSSLQDFVDCQKRFELRYLLRIRWPGFVTDEPEEVRRSVILGNRFHLLCHQFFTGLPVDTIRQSIDDEALLEWWNNFLNWRQDALGEGQYLPEITLHSHLAGRQVVAKFDLLQVYGTGIRIYDWKTSSTRHARSWLEKKIQTTLYPLVLCLAGQNLSSDPTLHSPENIEMVYWFANHPQNPEILSYSRYQFDEDRQYIEELINQISSIPRGNFEMTEDQRLCRFCTYRSFCDRHPDPVLTGVDEENSFETALENLAAAFENQLDEMPETWQNP